MYDIWCVPNTVPSHSDLKTKQKYVMLCTYTMYLQTMLILLTGTNFDRMQIKGLVFTIMI